MTNLILGMLCFIVGLTGARIAERLKDIANAVRERGPITDGRGNDITHLVGEKR